MADEFSSAITTLEDELITLRSQRDVLIDAANSTYSTVWDSFPVDETVVDWYVMEQFKNPWKFRESFLQRNMCGLVTALLFVIKQIFNLIAKVIIKLVEAASFAASATGAGALLAAATTMKYAFCLGWFAFPPAPGPFAMFSLILDLHKRLFKGLYWKFRMMACGEQPSSQPSSMTSSQPSASPTESSSSQLDSDRCQGRPFWNTLAGE